MASRKLPRESEIQRSILQYLRLKKLPCWRMNVLGIPLPNGGFRPNVEMQGVADIHVIVKQKGIGVSAWLEVKRPKGKQSDKQKEFQETVEKAGGLYAVVNSVDDVVEWLAQNHFPN